jgi:hypothetical protein
MSEEQKHEEADLAAIIQEAIQKAYSQRDPETSGLRSELAQERKKREQIEKRVNELIEENRQARQQAEQTERFAAIKAELQQLGVGKVDLAFRAVKDDVVRGEDGRLYARAEDGSLASLREHLHQWVTANPEFQPARIAGGAGAGPSRSASASGGFDLERIRPGMSAEELERARNEVVRVAAQALGQKLG